MKLDSTEGRLSLGKGEGEGEGLLRGRGSSPSPQSSPLRKGRGGIIRAERNGKPQVVQAEARR